MDVESSNTSRKCSLTELTMRFKQSFKKIVHDEVTKIMESREYTRGIAKEMKLLADDAHHHQSTLKIDSEWNHRPIQNLENHLSSIVAKLNKVSDQMDKTIQQDHCIEESYILEIVQSTIKKMATGKTIVLKDPPKLSTSNSPRCADDAFGTSESESFLLLSEKKKQNYNRLLKKFIQETRVQEMEDMFLSASDLDLNFVKKSFSFP